VTFDAHDPTRLGEFWSGILGREVVEHSGGVLLPGGIDQLGLRFITNPVAKTEPNLAHIHLTSATASDQEKTIAMAIDLGARHLDFGQTPADGHIVLADPDGNEFCVIEPGNNFLAGCGFFGELACDGSRDVGLFWSSALGWPLVWDQDQETAIQSPNGGTKVSWGGEPAAPPEVTRRHRFYLATDEDVGTEVDRLVSLGATRLNHGEGRSVILVDLDDSEFDVANS
jgi:catechol 2,3-dioxygenase-like lactoylglutathione lyase family enzyme